ncbi:MAG: hypothetical protein NT062_24120 [Proteobacteria bacterium]|nr:hypothetical protein [Pseudomonadota bacterium]
MRVFVSPHFDDVALSCGGRVRPGDLVISLFTRTRHRAVEQRRAAEDGAACALAGARQLDLGFDDAPDRVGIAPTFRALVLDAALDRALVRELRGAIRTHARGASEVWIPLGIGGHIDHRTTFAAAPRGARFYADRPYAFVPAFVALRRRELCGGRAVHLTPRQILAQIDAHHAAAFVTAAERRDVAAELSARLRDDRPRRTSCLRARDRRGSNLAMVACYRSQVRRIFGPGVGLAELAAFWPTSEREYVLTPS